MRPSVLVIRLSALGDVVLSGFVFHSIKEAWPDAHIAVLTRPAYMPVPAHHPAVDEVIPYEGFAAAVRTIRQHRFTHVLDLHGVLRSFWLQALSGAPHRARYRKSAVARRLFVRTRVKLTGFDQHRVDRYLDSLLAWGIRRTPSPNSGFGAPGRRSRQAPSSRVIGIHPGSAVATKRWPADRFAALARRIRHELESTVVIVGGPDDAEVARSVELLAAGACEPWQGPTSLEALIAVLPTFDLFITNDSGPMHLAAGCGIPTLAIFGPTTRELGFFPYGDGHTVMEAELECRPCHVHGPSSCPKGHFRCMGLVTVEQVFEAAETMLARRLTAEAT